MQHNVQLLHWPADRDRRESMVARAQPCVWAVAPGEAPPDQWGPLEDWVRDGTDERDLSARIERVKLRAEAQRAAPALDHDGVLWWRDRCAPLAPVEARLMGAFLASVQRVVNHD